MRKIILIVSGALAILAIVIGGSWISAYNGAIVREAEVVEARGNVHAALEARYVKVDVLIGAIEDANATIEGYLTIIADAREAFAAAIENGNAAAADEAAALADGTFVTLVAYMEENPDSYNTVSLYSGFISEFNASTNVVTFMIIEYNGTVTDYNTHIKTFPNIIFVGGRAVYNSYELTNYNLELPTFK
ncbi:MAG TPA: LemA family protein [Bacilli bacterium]|jgi:LemA protein|nr:LemA family protein [Bacilli bacterium]HOR20304.1 LemA family protein [Bacilli bacterium]HPK67263.1 LemA family protein [Bacilli bacterium]